jgi:hypothetical protein
MLLEQNAGGFATQMIQTPNRQPVRQILQRHIQDSALGTERTEARITMIRGLAAERSSL